MGEKEEEESEEENEGDVIEENIKDKIKSEEDWCDLVKPCWC